LCGEGIALALRSAELAAQSHLAGEAADVYQRRLAKEVGLRVVLATGLSKSLVWPKAQWLLGGAAQRAPRLLAHVAALTRCAAQRTS
jgi:hypothetical protein